MRRAAPMNAGETPRGSPPPTGTVSFLFLEAENGGAPT